MCANPFWEMDIQVTYTRGALRLRKPQREKYYRYSFDAEGRLLLVENFCDVDQIEVIVRKGDRINEKRDAAFWLALRYNSAGQIIYYFSNGLF